MKVLILAFALFSVAFGQIRNNNVVSEKADVKRIIRGCDRDNDHVLSKEEVLKCVSTEYGALSHSVL